MSTSKCTTYSPSFTLRTDGQITEHPGELFSIEKSGLARVAELFLLNELWKAIEMKVSEIENPGGGFFGGVPRSILTETEGVSRFWSQFYGPEKNLSSFRRFRITMFSNAGWGLTGHIAVDPAVADTTPWLMFKFKARGESAACTKFRFHYEGGWGDDAVMKRDFMLLRLKGELDGSY